MERVVRVNITINDEAFKEQLSEGWTEKDLWWNIEQELNSNTPKWIQYIDLVQKVEVIEFEALGNCSLCGKPLNNEADPHQACIDYEKSR